MSREENYFPHHDKGIYEYYYYSSITTYISLIIKKQNFLTGYYYAVDSRYSNIPGFLTPYLRYHLRDYRGPRKEPRSSMELFNYRHSSLCNVIERYFGVLKCRFRILKVMPNYPPHRQRLIPIACCVLHNFIRKEAQRVVV